jgi:hypothetical protein
MNPQTSQITEARAFVIGELDSCQLSVVSRQLPADSKPETRKSKLRACSICDRAQPAAGFRKVVGRTTTEACGDCCDRRESFKFQVSSFETQLKEFCLRLALKRRRHISSRRSSAESPVDGESSARGPLSHAPLFSRETANGTRGRVRTQDPTQTPTAPKEKSALAKSEQEYAKWLQRFPDRAAAIVAKTYAVMGDDAIKNGIPDDVALVQIMDLLNEGDDTLIPRNANKKLARPRRPS